MHYKVNCELFSNNFYIFEILHLISLYIFSCELTRICYVVSVICV